MNLVCAVAFTVCGQWYFDRHDPRDMPVPEQGIMVKIPKNTDVFVDSWFHKDCAFENGVTIYAFPTGEVLYDCTNFNNSPRTYHFPTHDSDEPRYAMIAAHSKTSGPDGSKPWFILIPKLIDVTDNLIVAATADCGNQQRYTSGKITVRSSKIEKRKNDSSPSKNPKVED